MKDSWDSGDHYENFMGRWSSIVGQSFLDWLAPPNGQKWLDVGCGSGALSEVVAKRYQPAGLTAIDQSEGYIKMAQNRLGKMANCKIGDALALPMEDSSVDFTVSGLVLNFIPEKERAISEMKRVTARGGSVAVYVWDYAEKMAFLKIFWDTVVDLYPGSSHLHEGIRFQDTNPEALNDLFNRAGLEEVVNAPIEINTYFRNFDDYWQPFLGGQGPAPTYVLSLNETEREKLRDALYEKMPIRPDGSIPLTARAWAIKGRL